MRPAGVRCRDLHLRYGGLAVLGGLDLDVAPGEFVAVVGTSGCGKSTLLRVIAGLEALDAGSVEPTPVLGRAALMPQHDCLLPWRTLVDNVALGPARAGSADARAAARQGLEAFGLEGFASALPATLSGGMRQRGALLRTVLAGKRLLLLDEPLGALDSLTRLELQDWLESLWLAQGPDRPAVVLVTHDVPEAVRLAERVAVLSPRPAVTAAVFPVRAPHPRPAGFRHSPEATRTVADILGALGRVDAGG